MEYFDFEQWSQSAGGSDSDGSDNDADSEIEPDVHCKLIFCFQKI